MMILNSHSKRVLTLMLLCSPLLVQSSSEAPDFKLPDEVPDLLPWHCDNLGKESMQYDSKDDKWILASELPPQPLKESVRQTSTSISEKNVESKARRSVSTGSVKTVPAPQTPGPKDIPSRKSSTICAGSTEANSAAKRKSATCTCGTCLKCRLLASSRFSIDNTTSTPEPMRPSEDSPKPTPSKCPNGTSVKKCTTGKKCLKCRLRAGAANAEKRSTEHRRLGDPEWLKARRRLSNRRDSPVLLRLLEEIRQAQDA